MSKPNTSHDPEPQWAAFIAVDWGDKKHHWKLREVATGKEEAGVLENRPEELDRWAGELRDRFQEQPIALCLEQSRGAVVYQLSKYQWVTLYPVHTTVAARYREMFYPSGAKNDPLDAAALLDLLVNHRGKLRRLDPDTAETRELQILVEQRRAFVDSRTAWSNRLRTCLKEYFPQVLSWIEDIDSPLGCDFLEAWPSLAAVQRAHPGTLNKFFLSHNCRSQRRIQERINGIYQATPATRDAAILAAGPRIVSALVAAIRPLTKNIKELDQRILELVQAHPETDLFAKLPGAGPVLLPRLIVAFGTKRERYSCADDLESYSGIAPVEVKSGRLRWVHFRRACPKFLRQTFHEFAAHSTAKSAWAKAHYDLKRSEGKKHHAAVRSLAFKWIRVLYRCWRDRIPYDEQLYLTTLQKRNSPLLRFLATNAEWTTVAGFQKLSPKKA